jgi:hypothetical protein
MAIVLTTVKSIMKKNSFFYFLSLVLAVLTLNGCKNNDCARSVANYGTEVDNYAKIYNLPSSYLKALIVLESSGKKPANSRFENRVYKRLVLKYKGRLSVAAIKNLSTSWGPFQLMGYQVNKLNIHVKDIRGANCVKWGIKWINDSYGNYLREGKFEEAFRIHNTGKPNGRTFDPEYVKNGLKYIKYFTFHN